MFYLKTTISFAWKAIPSEARVTRDEVSGLQTRGERLSGRQYQLMNCNTQLKIFHG